MRFAKSERERQGQFPGLHEPRRPDSAVRIRSDQPPRKCAVHALSSKHCDSFSAYADHGVVVDRVDLHGTFAGNRVSDAACDRGTEITPTMKPSCRPGVSPISRGRAPERPRLPTCHNRLFAIDGVVAGW